MIGGLGDRYSEFFDPAGFRAAIRRPTQAELDYLSNQAVGVCMLPRSALLPSLTNGFEQQVVRVTAANVPGTAVLASVN